MSGAQDSAFVMDPAEAVRLAAEAKTKVCRGGARAATTLSVREIIAMATVLNALLIDAFPEREPSAAPKPDRGAL